MLDPDLATSNTWRVPATFLVKPGGEAAGTAIDAREWNGAEMRALIDAKTLTIVRALAEGKNAADVREWYVEGAPRARRGGPCPTRPAPRPTPACSQ